MSCFLPVKPRIFAETVVFQLFITSDLQRIACTGEQRPFSTPHSHRACPLTCTGQQGADVCGDQFPVRAQEAAGEAVGACDDHGDHSPRALGGHLPGRVHSRRLPAHPGCLLQVYQSIMWESGARRACRRALCYAHVGGSYVVRLRACLMFVRMWACLVLCACGRGRVWWVCAWFVC